MSILRKPYEISVWDDVWSTDKFIEQRLGIIGSDKMQSQSRVIEPELTQNVNGTKKFSFKLYKRYKDNITGELIENPFYSWLANERKVKLNYDGTWYDFVIKNISEPSSNYLYTYQLEDANVQELSKNGFNFIFDAELQNNLGTSKELAEALLKDTDWTVDNCDIPVQTIDEALVYLKVTNGEGIVAKQIADQLENNQTSGIDDKKDVTIPYGAVILAAYSSCTSRPHRFQFFYVGNEDDEVVNESNIINKTIVDDNRFITNDNCQYYIDFNDPEIAYWETNNYIIPIGFSTTTVVEYPGENGITLSSKFRGRRYGFTQQTQYIPGLERYVNLYKDADDKTYYGYEHTEYLSPILIQNLISGSQLKSTSGWVGTTTILNGDKATVEAVYGRNPGANFVSSLEDIANGQYNENNDYASYIKITFPSDANAIALNSGPHDNRRLIGNMEVGDQYKIDCDYYGTDNNLQFTLGEYVYSSDGKYNSIDENITFSNSNNIFTVTTSNYSKEEFTKESEVRLCISRNSKDSNNDATYYIKSISLYKVAYYTDSEGQQKIITPDSAITGNENTVDTTYYYIDASITPTSPDSVIPTTITKILTYDTYKPVYNEGGCKVRTVTAKESNYFNILQSIAETFGQWLEINVTHSEDGTRLSKSVAFRNYVGHNNYAGFKYGVNLKDIKRTYESKKLVTKLIVKQNSNEFAPNGFCTIARADANPTGENTIYDFQYFFNTGMMSARDYLETTYVVNNSSLNKVQGYFPRIRDYNIQIQKDNDTLLNLSKDLVQISAELEVATVGAKAALDGIEETDEQIRFLTGYNISGLNTYLSSIEDGKQILERSDVKKAIQEYSVYKSELKKYEDDKTRLEKSKATIEDKYSEIADNIKTNTESKEALHKEFFATYCRFIQEGTWISEDYVDDEKYYADALSVLYNSCYPKVAYDVNVIEISKLPGYENYAYNLGDITFVEDKEFFGDDFRVEVSVTETTDNLDDPSKNKIKVQNFKDQFQDLFQKITATVQQTQYNTGSYEKAVALAEAGQERKQQFLTDALDGMSSRLAVAGQQTVVIDSSGITVTDDDTPSESIRMVGGAIMLSKQDANGETKWTTGLTSDGISANLITAGVINAGQIAIMNSDQPAFRWDTYGISAFDTTTYEGTTSGFNYDKFVRFDKNGIYGIDGTVNGLNWHPQDGKELDDINEKATFALTWEGLKITGDGGIAWIGKHSYDTGLHDGGGNSIIASGMIRITNNEGKETFCVSNDGNVVVRGNLFIGNSTVESLIESKISSTTNTNDFSWKFSTTEGMYMYAGKQDSNNVVFKVYNDNGTKKLYIKGDGEFTGKITANGGKIAGFDIIKTAEQKQYICSNSKGSYNDKTVGIYLGQDGIGLGNGSFYVKDNGYLHSTSGNIGGFSITTDAIYNGKTTYDDNNNEGVYLGTNGIGLGKGAFYVKSNGEMYCGNGNITGGSIKIGGDNNNPNFYVDGSGNVKMVGSIVLGGNIKWKNGPPAELKGDQGIPGENGKDGKTSYFHIAYATSANGADFSTTVSAGKTYIGQYTDHIAEDSQDWSKYNWTLIKGEKGDKGDRGAPGSNAYVTREVLLYLNYQSDDGLYRYTKDGNTYLGINATAIRTGYLGFKKSVNEGNEEDYYIDPFGNSEYYIKLPNLCISTDEWDYDSFIRSNSARLGIAFFNPPPASQAPLMLFDVTHGLTFAASGNRIGQKTKITWAQSVSSGNVVNPRYSLRGDGDGLHLEIVDGSTDYDFYIFGTSWKDVLSRLATVESKLGISSGGGSGSNTSGSTDTHEHTYENNVCTVCSKTKCEIEGKHKYSDGSCTRCGATDPDYSSGCSHDLANPEGWTVAPTCISEGEEVWYCPECQKEWHQVVPRDPDLHAGEKGEPTWADGGYQGGTWSCCGVEWHEPIS